MIESRKRGGSAVPVGQVLKAVFEEMERQKNFSREDIQAKWEEITGKFSAKHSRPVVYRKGNLTVHVDSPSYLHDLTIRKRTILKQLKRLFGKDRIAEIQFKIGEI